MDPQNQNNAKPPAAQQPNQSQQSNNQQAPSAAQPQAAGATPPPPSQQMQPRVEKKPINPNSTQNHLKIAEIRDGIAIMDDGSFRAVVMVKSINFDLMSPSEQEAVEYSYQSFLNSLYFPIQIYIRSQKIDMADYIAKLDKIRSEHDNMLLSLLMEDYIDFIGALSEQTNIMNKSFYVVVPYFPNVDSPKSRSIAKESKNMLSGLAGLFSSSQTHIFIDEKKLEEAKTELRNRVQSVLAGLDDCGVKGIPLDTQELIELYYDVYNPDTATRQKLRNFDDLKSPVVSKGEGQAPQPQLDKELEA